MVDNRDEGEDELVEPVEPVELVDVVELDFVVEAVPEDTVDACASRPLIAQDPVPLVDTITSSFSSKPARYTLAIEGTLRSRHEH